MNLFKKSFSWCFFILLLSQCSRDPHEDKMISPEEVHRIVYDSVDVTRYVVLDVRNRMDYVRGHVVSAYWLNPDSISERLATLVKEKAQLIIYGRDESQTQEIATVLSDKEVAGCKLMKGGFAAWTKLGYPAAIQLVRNTNKKISLQRTNISIAAAHDLLGNLISQVVLVDIREYPAFVEGHIEGALSIPYVPLNEFVVGIEQHNFARNRPIIIYCDEYSDIGEKAVDVMLRNDFTQVYLLKCGLAEWESVR